MSDDQVTRLRDARKWFNDGQCCGQVDSAGICAAPACIFGEALKEFSQAADRIEKQAAEIERLRAKVDAVYSERNRLAAALARMALAAGFKAGKGVDPDETKWPVIYVDTPNGQVSWHIAEADAHVLEGLPQYGEQWDGTFKARDAAWPVWPITNLVAAARREGIEEAAKRLIEKYQSMVIRPDTPEAWRFSILQDLRAMAGEKPNVITAADIDAAAIRAAAKEGKP